MNAEDLKNALATAVGLIDTLAPIAESIGGPAVAAGAKIAQGVADFAASALKAVDDGTIVMNAEDMATVQAALADLQSRNDALAATIAAS